MAIRDVPGRPVVGFFAFTPYPKPLPVGQVLSGRPIVAIAKKRPKVRRR